MNLDPNTATGKDLDHIGALFNTSRLWTETDRRFCNRILIQIRIAADREPRLLDSAHVHRLDRYGIMEKVYRRPFEREGAFRERVRAAINTRLEKARQHRFDKNRNTYDPNKVTISMTDPLTKLVLGAPGLLSTLQGAGSFRVFEENIKKAFPLKSPSCTFTLKPTPIKKEKIDMSRIKWTITDVNNNPVASCFPAVVDEVDPEDNEPARVRLHAGNIMDMDLAEWKKLKSMVDDLFAEYS